MKYLLVLTIALVVLAGEVYWIGRLVLAPALSPAARNALDRYLDVRYSSDSARFTVDEMIRARDPRGLREETNTTSYGDGIYYATSHSFGPYPTPATPPALFPGPSASRPVPYPPEQVWCARIHDPRGHSTVILVALHMDLHNAAWIVHDPGPAYDRITAAIGCQ